MKNIQFIRNLYPLLRGLVQTSTVLPDGSTRFEMQQLALHEPDTCAVAERLALHAQMFVTYNRGHSHLMNADKPFPFPIKDRLDSHTRTLYCSLIRAALYFSRANFQPTSPLLCAMFPMPRTFETGLYREFLVEQCRNKLERLNEALAESGARMGFSLVDFSGGLRLTLELQEKSLRYKEAFELAISGSDLAGPTIADEAKVLGQWERTLYKHMDQLFERHLDGAIFTGDVRKRHDADRAQPIIRNMLAGISPQDRRLLNEHRDMLDRALTA